MSGHDDQRRQNEATIEVLRDHGDTLTEVREIDHWAYFPTSEARAEFIEKCVAAGLKLRSTRDPDESLKEFGVQLFHIDIPTEEAMNQVTCMLSDFAAAVGGEYDGWETQVQ